MQETEARRRTPFDWLGFAALGIAIGALQLMLDRGEQLGWFDSQEIIAEGLVSLAAFYFFLAHSLTTPRPFISFEIFRDRNFVIGLCFMFLCGVLLLGTAALMAPFLQNLAGYPVLDAGMLLGMRGVGTMVAMMLVGRLVARHDLRLLIGVGLAGCVLSLYQSMDFSLDTTALTIAWVGALQGAGLGFLFVPLNTMAFATLPAASRTEGTAMWTLIRNLGSSIGVSVVIANLSNKTILMHARLMEAVTPFNQALSDPAAALLNPSTETGRALLDDLITQQAGIIAYANDFKLLMMLTIIAFPLLLLIRPYVLTPAR
jgi:MFS transporter, DHA2 family, multidrug resistance protein